MVGRILPLSLAVFLVAVQANLGQDAKKGKEAKDIDKFQGTWEVVDFVANGKSDKQFVGKAKFIIMGDKMSMVGSPDENKSFSLKLNEKTRPKSLALIPLDGEFKGEMVQSIYRFQGDMLQFCAPNSPKTKEAPKEFAAPDGSSYVLITLKRAKK